MADKLRMMGTTEGREHMIREAVEFNDHRAFSSPPAAAVHDWMIGAVTRAFVLGLITGFLLGILIVRII